MDRRSGTTRGPTRRQFLARIGAGAGAAAMYHAAASLGVAAASPFTGPLSLSRAPAGSSVLILGAGLAGLVAAYELGKAGYQVEILEYRDRPGGRCWTLRGGDSYTELGGYTQQVGFDDGLYFNPGPWRIPYHHAAVLHYCRLLKVPLEPFVQLNHNALLHSTKAFDGRPQRYRTVAADMQGHTAELLAKLAHTPGLDDALAQEDREQLLEALREVGALDREFRYVAGDAASHRRGFARDPGGGPEGAPQPSNPVGLSDLLRSELWQHLGTAGNYEFQTTLLQPVGGMDRIARALADQITVPIHYRARVTEIRQSPDGVTVRYEDQANDGVERTASARWCLCTIPLSILGQIAVDAGPELAAAIGAISYHPSVKVGLQFRRRFWEEDEAIYGGISYTDQPISMIAYPNHGMGAGGKGVLLGGYMWGPDAYEFTALEPAERVRRAVAQGTVLHPQYPAEFETGVGVGWHRVPWTLGCFANWRGDLRDTHYRALCGIDGRLLLAGEHASYLPAWQEGAVLSALDAVSRLHARVLEVPPPPVGRS